MKHWLIELQTETPSSPAHSSQRPPPRNLKTRPPRPRARARALEHVKHEWLFATAAASPQALRLSRTTLHSLKRHIFSYHSRPRTLSSSSRAPTFLSHVANVFFREGDTNSQWKDPSAGRPRKMLADLLILFLQALQDGGFGKGNFFFLFLFFSLQNLHSLVYVFFFFTTATTAYALLSRRRDDWGSYIMILLLLYFYAFARLGCPYGCA